MDTIIKITYTNYTENVIVTAQNIDQVLSVVKNDDTCKGMEVVQQGVFKFENNYTKRKVANATKKADKLEASLFIAQEKEKACHEQLQSSCVKLPYSILRKASKKAGELVGKIESQIEAHTNNRLTAYSFRKMELDVCCGWGDYSGIDQF